MAGSLRVCQDVLGQEGSPGPWCSFLYKPSVVNKGQRIYVNMGETFSQPEAMKGSNPAPLLTCYRATRLCSDSGLLPVTTLSDVITGLLDQSSPDLEQTLRCLSPPLSPRGRGDVRSKLSFA